MGRPKRPSELGHPVHKYPEKKAEPFENEGFVLTLLIERGKLWAFEIRNLSPVKKGSYLFTLGRMVERGLVTVTEEVKGKRRYEVTEKGRDVYRAWLVFRDALNAPAREGSNA